MEKNKDWYGEDWQKLKKELQNEAILSSTTEDMQDTPEEWEKNRKKFSEYWANHSHEEAQEWLDDKDKLGRPEYTMEECIKVVRYYIRQDTKAQELIYYIKQLLDEREREVRKQERMIRLHKRVSKKIDNLEEPYKSFAKAGAGII